MEDSKSRPSQDLELEGKLRDAKEQRRQEIPDNEVNSGRCLPGQSLFELLPYLVFDAICGYLDDEGHDRGGLFALSLASRSCCAATNSRRFSQLVITVRPPDEFHERLETLDKMLDFGDGRRYGLVRRMKVQGPPAKYHDWQIREVMPGCETGYEAEVDGDALNNYSNHTFAEMHPFCRPRAMLAANVYEHVHYEHSLWTTLTGILQKMNSLQDLVWMGASDCLPRPIFDFVRETHESSTRNWNGQPRAADEKRLAHPVRLHLSAWNFGFPSQEYHGAGDTGQPPLNKSDWELAASPALTSLAIYSMAWTPRRERNKSEMLLRRMLNGLAPNLQYVWLGRRDNGLFVDFRAYTLGEPGDNDGREGRLEDDDEDDWKDVDFETAQPSEPRHGKLRALKIVPKLEPFPLGRFSVANLKSLHFVWKRGIGEKLAGLILDGRMPCLDSIRLENVYSSTPRAQAAMRALLCHNTRPLVEFALSGYFNQELFDILLENHGATLQVLSIEPHYDDSEGRMDDDFDDEAPDDLFAYTPVLLREVAARCPNLQELDVTMKRTRSDRQEMGFYRALRDLPHLRRLRLRLECWVYGERALERHYARTGGREYIPRHGQEKMLTNCAVDRLLAEDIFKFIGQNGKGALEYLRVEPTVCMEHIHETKLHSVMEVLARHWVLRLDRGDSRGSLRSWEVNKGRAESAARHCSQMLGEKYFHYSDDPDPWPEVFMGLWGSDETNWWTKWESIRLPTAGDSDEGAERA